jgi:YD repeat-containing protein
MRLSQDDLFRPSQELVVNTESRSGRRGIFATIVMIASLSGMLLTNDAAQAQDVSCPTNGTVCFDTGGGGCNPNFTWPPHSCNCEGNLFLVHCDGGYGGSCNGNQCGLHCEFNETDTPCVAMETIGTPPLPPPGVPAPPQPPSCAGHPVSVTTGEMFFTHLDARVGEIEITRSYNTARLDPPGRHGVLGPGWNMSTDARIRVISYSLPRVIELRVADGAPTYYLFKDSLGYFKQQLPYGEDSWIEETADGFRRTLRRGGAETYDTNGRLQTITDASGRLTQYGRDSEGRLISVSTRGRTVTLVYDIAGLPDKLGRIVGPAGTIVTYGYDYIGRLHTVDYPGVTNAGYRFEYADASQWAPIVLVTDASVPNPSRSSSTLTSMAARRRPRLPTGRRS